MKTLMIKDLTRTEELDRKAMASVTGGTMKTPYFGPAFSINKESFSFSAEQLISQNQETLVNNGNNVAFASGIKANVKPKQDADNTINFFG